MALILRGWAGIEKASSHSGRRSVITDIIHKQKKSLKVAQKVAGHKSASTTVIYDEPPEEATSPGGHPKSPTDGHLKIPHLRT